MNLFQILDCSPSMETLISAVRFILTMIRWAIPIVLIILGSIDMFKAMASGDEKKTQEARKTFIRRLIYAVVAFLIPFIVELVFNFAGQIVKGNANIDEVSGQNGNFFSCWYEGGNSGSNSSDKACWVNLADGSWTTTGENSSNCAGCYDTLENCAGK